MPLLSPSFHRVSPDFPPAFVPLYVCTIFIREGGRNILCSLRGTKGGGRVKAIGGCGEEVREEIAYRYGTSPYTRVCVYVCVCVGVLTISRGLCRCLT